MRRIKEILCVILICVLLLAGVMGSSTMAVSADGVVDKYALVMSAPYEDFVFEDCHDYMVNLFESYGIITYDHEQPVGGSAAMFLAKITNKLSCLDSDDIAYVYINSHGNYNSIQDESYLAVGGKTQNVSLYMHSLKSCLDNLNGHIILILDACKSGGAVGRDLSGTGDELDKLMLQDFFQPVGRDAEFVGDNKYTVICSSLSTEVSNSSYPHYSNASYVWAMAAGLNMASGQFTTKLADVNADSIITVKELYDYSAPIINGLCYGTGTQTMCYYSPSDYYSFLYWAPSASASSVPLGDVNQNEQITTADANLVRSYLLGTANLSSRQKQLADMNGDGGITMADVLAINQFVASMA